MLEKVRLIYGWGHRRRDLEAYGVTSGERSAAEAEGMLSYTWMADQVRPAFNEDFTRILTMHKWVFYRLMAGFDVPVPPTLGLYHPVDGLTWDGARRLRTVQDVIDEVDRVRPPGLVLKPAGGGQGKGLLILDDIDHSTRRAVDRTGALTDVAAAVASVAPEMADDPLGYIVQVPVTSHPVLAELAPWTTNGLRVITLVDRAGTVHILAAATALGRRGRMANNVAAGGLGVGIDLATGELGRGRLQDPLTWVTEHPDNGLTFTGVRVPFWQEVLDTCSRAALLVPGTRSIGWDVVVTESGPVLLEGNERWTLLPLQLNGPPLLSDPAMRELLIAAGAPMPDGSLVRNGPRRLLKEGQAAVKRLRGRIATWR